VPVVRAELTFVGGDVGYDLGGTAGTVRKVSVLLGSAVGGALQLQLRDDLARVRAALGKRAGASPQKLSEKELREIFKSFGASERPAEKQGDLVLTYAEMTKAVSALGVKMTPDEQREMLYALDAEAAGYIRFKTFARWWDDLVTASPVALVHTEREYDLLSEEEATSGRLLVLMVGFTFCRPCKKFSPLFREFATKYPAARFAYMSGNENADTGRVGRDRLGVTGSPAFFLTKNGVTVAKFSGAKEDVFRAQIEAHIGSAAPVAAR
jgi:thioredoxin 1